MTPFLILGFLAGGTPDADAAAVLALARAARERHPVVKALPAKPTPNGLNCRASFCTAQGGPGCAATGRNCPNGVGGVCVCGAKPAAVQAPPTFGYLLPGTAYQSCPGGNCPTGR